jgi:hypothetical protein
MVAPIELTLRSDATTRSSSRQIPPKPPAAAAAAAAFPTSTSQHHFSISQLPQVTEPETSGLLTFKPELDTNAVILTGRSRQP